MAPLIQLQAVSKSFAGLAAVADVSLDIGTGEFFALLGPSGCGKTTLLRLIAGFERPDKGHILLDGDDMSRVPPWNRPVNTVFQSYALFPHMTVAANIAFGLRQDGMARPDIRKRVGEMLELVRLEDFALRKPHQLSGGQRQRVALARSLAKRPKALLLDEPLAALDRKLRDEMRAELSAIQRRLGITFIFVTHDQDEAMTLADRFAIMRAGRLEQVGAPREVYEKPQSRYVADFLGRANILAGKVIARDGAFLRLETAVPGLLLRVPSTQELAPGAEVWLAIRPENVMLGLGGVEGTVRDIAYTGEATHFALELDGGIVLRATVAHAAGRPGPKLERGNRIPVAWPAEAGVLLTR